MHGVSAYMFPCPKCSKSAATQVDLEFNCIVLKKLQQVDETLSYLRTHNAKIDTLWLDIEGAQYWHSSHGANQQFFQQLARNSVKQSIAYTRYRLVRYKNLVKIGESIAVTIK